MQDKAEEVKLKSYDKERDEYLAKMIGCSKDHGKEIDLYGKSYNEKIERIKTMINEAEKSTEDMQKRAYYYAQALLVFYYLIPETEEEDIETKDLELRCHRS